MAVEIAVSIDRQRRCHVDAAREVLSVHSQLVSPSVAFSSAGDQMAVLILELISELMSELMLVVWSSSFPVEVVLYRIDVHLGRKGYHDPLQIMSEIVDHALHSTVDRHDNDVDDVGRDVEELSDEVRVYPSLRRINPTHRTNRDQMASTCVAMGSTHGMVGDSHDNDGVYDVDVDVIAMPSVSDPSLGRSSLGGGV